jgi:hypothetical protein
MNKHSSAENLFHTTSCHKREWETFIFDAENAFLDFLKMHQAFLINCQTLVHNIYVATA